MEVKKNFFATKSTLKNRIFKKHCFFAFARKKEKLASEKPVVITPMLKTDKNQGVKKFFKMAAVVTVVGIMAISLYPIINQYIIESNINNLPVENNSPVEFFDNPSIDENGSVIESPDIQEELANAYAFFEDKLANDATEFEIELGNINSIKGIYAIKLANDNFSKDTAIQIIVNSNNKDYIFEYTALEEDFKDGFNIETNVNNTNTILSFTSNLLECYPSNVIEQDEQKTELVQKIKEITGKDSIVGDPIVFVENAVSNEFQIPVYQNENCLLYSIKESVLADHCEDINFDIIVSLLADYIEGKNDLFEIKTVEQIKEANSIYNAISSAYLEDAEENS